MKTQTINMPWSCTRCGARRVEFQAQCGSCGAWNAFARAGFNVAATAGGGQPGPARRLDSADAAPNRLATGVPYLDRVLGGGFVAGATVLISGEPGAGKSTLAAEALFWAAVRARRWGLYCSGEEGMVQVRDRLERLRLSPGWVYFNHPAELSRIMQDLRTVKPPLFVLDSVQVLDDRAARGSEQSRRRQAFRQLLGLLQSMRIPALLLSQVNVRGEPSGGKDYSHLPDVVLEIRQPDPASPARVLTVKKNRFGPVCVVNLEMTATGLKESGNA